MSSSEVTNFKYLGSVVTADGGQDRELSRRLGLAASAFHQLHSRVLGSRNVSLRAKVEIYKAVVLSVMLYGAPESWALTATQRQRLDVFHTTCLRRIMGVRRSDEVPNEFLFMRSGLQAISLMIVKDRCRWLGHWLAWGMIGLQRSCFSHIRSQGLGGAGGRHLSLGLHWHGMTCVKGACRRTGTPRCATDRTEGEQIVIDAAAPRTIGICYVMMMMMMMKSQTARRRLS